MSEDRVNATVPVAGSKAGRASLIAVPRRYRRKPVEIEAMQFTAATSSRTSTRPSMPDRGHLSTLRALTTRDCQQSRPTVACPDDSGVDGG